MTQESKVAFELLQMFHNNEIPLSVAEDIHEAYGSLLNGDTTVEDLKNKNDFMSELVQKAENNLTTH